jgi:type VI secretion system secreted protein VgrG
MLRPFKFSLLAVTALLLTAPVVCTSSRADAQSIPLGAAGSFSILGASAVTNTGTTTVSGNVGVSPGTSATGFETVVITGGNLHLNDQVAIDAHADAVTAYNQLAALAFTQDLSATDLGGRTLGAGVYSYASTADFNGILTLDGAHQADALFVIQIGSTLTTANASFNFINGASADDVWFQVGTSATLGIGTAFSGTLIANASNTLSTGVTVNGRIIALTGAVTLNNNHIIQISAIPEPATNALILSGLALMLVGGLRLRKRKAAFSSDRL